MPMKVRFHGPCGPRRRGEVPEWPKGADCKSAGDAFEGSNPSLSTTFLAGIAQLVEREPSKLGVAGSSPVSRSSLYTVDGRCQMAIRDCDFRGRAINQRLMGPGSSVGRARPW
jgi:hypothetical protein